MTLASLLVLASTGDSLWNLPNLYWPFALLGLICGLIAAWWTWCHRWLILARDAKLETEYLNGCVEALESSIPFLASHHETSTKLQALQEQIAAQKDQTERTNATLASRDFEVAKLNHSLTHSREIEQLQARQIAALKTDVLSLTDTLESQDGEALTLKNEGIS